MSTTPLDQITAQGAVAEAQARARDQADAAVADAAMAGADVDPGQTLPDTPLTLNSQSHARPSVTRTPRTGRDLSRIGGDATGDLQTDDFGLDGNLQGLMERSLEAAFADDLAEDPASTSTSSTADTAATPDPAQTSPDAASAPGDDGAGVGGAAGVGAASPPAAPDSAPTDRYSLDEAARAYFGTDLDRQTSENLFGVLAGLQTASPEQRQQIDAILANRYAPMQGTVPMQQPQVVEQASISLPGAAEVPIPGLPPRPPDTDYEQQQIYDRYIAPLAQAQAAQVQALRADIDRTTQQQLAQQREQGALRVEAAAAEWRAAHPILTDDEYNALTLRVIQSGTFEPLVQAHHGDVAAATNAIYEQNFWANPILRDRALAAAASGRDPMTALPDPASPISAEQQQLEAGRRALAGSVAGGGGHTPVRNPPAPRTAAERKTAMVSEIAAHMEGAT